MKGIKAFYEEKGVSNYDSIGGTTQMIFEVDKTDSIECDRELRKNGFHVYRSNVWFIAYKYYEDENIIRVIMIRKMFMKITYSTELNIFHSVLK